MKRLLRGWAATLLVAAMLTGCGGGDSLGDGPGGEITCREYVNLIDASRLGAPDSGIEQENAVRRMLKAHGRSTDDTSVFNARAHLTLYCSVDGSGNYPPGPIEDAFIWD